MLVNPYKEEFKRIFTSRKEAIRACLGKRPRIEHFGSTAVTGLPGKGIIDILIGFRNKSQLLAATKKLISIGYFPSRKGQVSRGDRIFLSSNKGESTIGNIHLHLVLEESENFRRPLRFRNRLRRDKALRNRYLKIKKGAAMAAEGKRELYTKLKSEFIEEASDLNRK
jgi:GrpB-like predicted nucleotidyltransferase (UPF0157 family)